MNAKRNDGRTALMAASELDHLGVVKLLLAAKVDVNAKANNGSTALTLAAQKGHSEVVLLLKKTGAIGDVPVQKKTCYAEVPSYAESGGYRESQTVEVPCNKAMKTPSPTGPTKQPGTDR